MEINSYSAASFMSWVLSQPNLKCPFINVHPRNAVEFRNCYSMVKGFPLLATEIKRMGMYSHEWRAVVDNWDEWKEFLIEGRYAALSELMTVVYVRLSTPSATFADSFPSKSGSPKRRNNRGGIGRHQLSDDDKGFIQKSRGRLSMKRIAAVLDRPYSTIIRNAKVLHENPL